MSVVLNFSKLNTLLLEDLTDKYRICYNKEKTVST